MEKELLERGPVLDEKGRPIPGYSRRSTLVYDHFERPILLFANQYTLNNFMQKNPEVKLVEALDVDDTVYQG